MYSTIQKRKCKCGNCNLYPTTGYAGYNQSHAPQLIADAKKSRNNKAKAAKNKRLVSKIKKLHTPDNDEAVELQEWYKVKMATSTKICENCGKDLSSYNEKDWKGCQHHIIDKSKINGCPSVATNRYNHGVLCKWECHSLWHSNYTTAQKMPFFKIAKQRFELFRNDIAPNELRKIPLCFIMEKLTNVS